MVGEASDEEVVFLGRLSSLCSACPSDIAATLPGSAIFRVTNPDAFDVIYAEHFPELPFYQFLKLLMQYGYELDERLEDNMWSFYPCREGMGDESEVCESKRAMSECSEISQNETVASLSSSHENERATKDEVQSLKENIRAVRTSVLNAMEKLSEQLDRAGARLQNLIEQRAFDAVNQYQYERCSSEQAAARSRHRNIVRARRRLPKRRRFNHDNGL